MGKQRLRKKLINITEIIQLGNKAVIQIKGFLAPDQCTFHYPTQFLRADKLKLTATVHI